MNRDLNVSLYTKRVLIKNKANEILPEWCGFLTGKYVLSISVYQICDRKILILYEKLESNEVGMLTRILSVHFFL